MAWSPDRHALRGRVAVVAGATRGAGRGIAGRYIEEIRERGLHAILDDDR